MGQREPSWANFRDAPPALKSQHPFDDVGESVGSTPMCQEKFGFGSWLGFFFPSCGVGQASHARLDHTQHRSQRRLALAQKPNAEALNLSNRGVIDLDT
jgi:hypothetical protein